VIAYRDKYGYPLHTAVIAEFWWRVEHLFPYRGEDGGLCGHLTRFAYRKRHEAERRGGVT